MKMKSTIEVKVRYQETDQMGVVYHGNYFTWFEIARVQLLEDLGCPYRELEKKGYFLPVLHCSCDFIKPSRFGDDLRIDVNLLSFIKIRLSLVYVVSKENEIIARGKSIHAFVDRNGKARKPPPYFQGKCNRLN